MKLKFVPVPAKRTAETGDGYLYVGDEVLKCRDLNGYAILFGFVGVGVRKPGKACGRSRSFPAAPHSWSQVGKTSLAKDATLFWQVGEESGNSYGRGTTRTLRLVLTSLLLAVVVLGCNAPGGSTSLTCTVTYDANGASGGTVPTDPQSPYSSGAKVTVLDNTGNLYKSSVAFAPPQIFRLASTLGYTVTYDVNGGSGTAPIDPNNPYGQGATVTVLGNPTNLTKSGATFAGWSTQINGTPLGATFIMGTSNVILYAVWTSNPSWAFAGWNTRSDGTGTTYASGQTFTITSNVTLYAVWKLGANFKRVPDDSRRQHLHQLANICLLWPATEKSGDSS